MATRNIVPRATGEGSLGTETKKWGNIYADNLHSSNPLPIANGGTGASTVAGARNALGLGNTTGALPIANGGTGASTAEQARTNLGLGNVATLNTVPIANGGTGATTAKQARTNLGLGNVATLNTVPIANGGTGATTASEACANIGASNQDLSNLSDTGKKAFFPSNTFINIPLDSSAVTNYTPPANGFIIVTATSEYDTCFIRINYGETTAYDTNTLGVSQNAKQGMGMKAWVPVVKNQIVCIRTNYVRSIVVNFIYANGEV